MPMTTRRQFCKNLCAAGLMPATLTSFAKFYCGMDFGSGDSTTVWHVSDPTPKGLGLWVKETASPS